MMYELPLDLRKSPTHYRITNVLNSLPEDIVTAQSLLNLFKNKLTT